MHRNRIAYIFVTVIYLLVTACGGSPNSVESHVAKSKTHLESGKLNHAAIELKNALKINPNHAEARYLLGEVNLGIGALPNAEKELTRALDLGYSKSQALPALALAFLEQGKLSEVLEIDVDSDLTRVAQADLLALKSIALLKQGNLALAAQLLDESSTANESSQWQRLAYSQMDIAEGDVETAKQALNALVVDYPDQPWGWSLLGDIAITEQDLKAADTFYSSAIDLGGLGRTNLIKRAIVRLNLEDYNAAQSDLDALLKLAPDSFSVNFVQGIAHYAQQNFMDAESVLYKAVGSNPKNLRARYYLAATQFSLGKSALAAENLESVLERSPNLIPGRKLLALIRFLEDDYVATEDLLLPVVEAVNDDTTSIDLLAASLLAQGKTDEAVILLEHAMELNPDSVQTKARLGYSLLLAGQDDEGMEKLNTLIDLHPELQRAEILIIMTHLRNKRFEDALTVAESYRQNHPEEAAPHNMLGLVFAAQSLDKDALAAFQAAKAISPSDPSANFNLASYALKNSDQRKAQQYYMDVLAGNPSNLEAALKVVELDALAGDRSAVVANLERLTTEHPSATTPRIMLANIYLSEGQIGKVYDALGDLQDDSADPAVLSILGESQLIASESMTAKRTLQKLVEVRPDSAKAHYLLALAHSQTGDIERTEAELSRAIALNPDYFLAHISLARLHLLYNKADLAKASLDKLLKTHPNHPDVLHLNGLLHASNSDQITALREFERAFEIAPSTRTLSNLAMQKWRMGNKDQSIQLQKEWVVKYPKDTSARLMLANSYASMKDNISAADHYSRVLDYSKDNLMALNNLAWVLMESQPKEALKYAHRAEDLAPDSPAIVDTVAVALFNNKDVESALRKSERALSLDPEAAALRYHNALIVAETGDKSTAADTLTSLLQDHANFPERGDAERLLDKLQSNL